MSQIGRSSRLVIASLIAVEAVMLDVAAAPESSARPRHAASGIASELFARRGRDAAGDLKLAVDRTLVAALQSQTNVVIQLPIAQDDHIRLQLTRFEVTTPNARFQIVAGDGSVTAAPIPKVLLLRGAIQDEPGSHAFLALTESGNGMGSIQRHDGSKLHLATDASDPDHPGLILHAGGGALPEFPDFCMAIDRRKDSQDAIAGSPGVNPAAGPRAVVVAIDGDQSYTQLFPTNEDALDYIAQLIAAVSDIYMRDLNMKLVLGFVRIWPEGGEPFGADDVSGFSAYWQANEDTTGLNLVHLLSARRDLGYGGIAFVADACNGDAYAISGFLNGGFPAPVTRPHWGNWDVNVVAHEMGHNLGTFHTHDYSPPVDTCASGTNERGTIMSYCHTRPGGLLNIDMRFHAVTQQIINSSNPSSSCLWHDCNGNNADDLDDIAAGSSFDANLNDVPDECEDCDGNGELDPADIASGRSADVNLNGVLDSCEADCNQNLVPDRWEIDQEQADDLNGNNVPDECEPDCDGNRVADFWDIHIGTHADIDRDSVPDLCQDCNVNQVADWIDVDRQFNVYIGEVGGAVREYHAASGVPVQELGTGTVLGAYDLAFGADRQLYVASYNNNRIVRIDVDAGTASIFVSSGSGGLGRPSALTFGPDGHLYVATHLTHSVLKFDGQTGAPLGVFVPSGSGQLQSPWDLVFRPNGNLLVVSNNNRILEYSGADGSFVGEFISQNPGNLNGPRGLAFLPSGELLVTNALGGFVTKYDSTGQLLGIFNDEYPVVSPWGLSIGPDGDVYVMRNDLARLIHYDVANGHYVRAFIRGDADLANTTQFAFRPPSPNDANGNDIPDDCDPPPTCAADISPTAGNQSVDVDDLLAVLDAWGPCPPSSCPSDINLSGIVDVDDLLAIINGWGPCP